MVLYHQQYIFCNYKFKTDKDHRLEQGEAKIKTLKRDE